MLDEPTSGLDPIVRREFIETVIGAYQSGDPGRRTVFVSTHLISEFEGLIDEFTIIEQGRASADHGSRRRARPFPQNQCARFSAHSQTQLDLTGRVERQAKRSRSGNSCQRQQRTDCWKELKSSLAGRTSKCESLSLEEIFVASDILKKAKT